mmetsp:Transcript_21951/g.86050  ORF Transcript_21951/g.86050 Transcript_21951/m.86050 type:complete len:536 (+) Transcript_21951:2893-4500(+)
MHRERRLPVLEGREVLGLGDGDGRVALDDTLDQATHGLQAERQRDHIQQQDLAIGGVARELVGLDGSADRHDLVRIQVGQHLAAEQLAHGSSHNRHARGATHHHGALHIGRLDLGVTQHALDGRQRLGDQRLGQGLELGAGHGHTQLAGVQRRDKLGRLDRRQSLLGCPRGNQHRALVVRRVEGPAGERPIGKGAVEVVATQGGITAGRHHLEHAPRQAQQRDVEGAAAQVVDGVEAFAGVVQAVGNGRRRGLVDEAKHLQAGQFRRILGGLALRVVEIGGHRDDGAEQVVIERVFGAEAQRRQDFGRHLDRTLDAVAGCDGQHAGALLEAVRQTLGIGDVGDAAAHEALDRHERVFGVVSLGRQRLGTDLAAALRQVAHRRRQDHPPLGVGQALGHAMPHRRDERVRGAQVNADGDTALVRIGRGARLGDLKKGHQASSAARRWSMSARKRWMNISALTCAAAAGASWLSSSRRWTWANAAASACAASSSSASSAASVMASSRASRQAICCIRKAGGMAVLFSACTGAPRSSQR